MQILLPPKYIGTEPGSWGGLGRVSSKSVNTGADEKMATHLFIVAWDRPDLWDYWRRWFSGVKDVQVILDRRRGERREPPEEHDPERRLVNRRSAPGITQELRSVGFAIVPRGSGLFPA